MPTFKRALVATTALVILGSPLVVHAQAAPAAAPAADSGMGEVVVHAQRRAERLQDVPLSVTAISGATLGNAGVSNSTELTMVTPGLQMALSGTETQPVIRGIGSSTSLPGAENNVATYIDGAYQLSVTGAFYDLPDVQSVDVLKGPQGTLFGRNATGGAILITTKAPNLQHMQGTASISYGNYNSLMASGFFTMPIIQDRLAFSVTGLYEGTSGWKTNVATGCKTCATDYDSLIRAKIRFIPWIGADFTLTGMFAQRDDSNIVDSTNFMGNNAATLGAAFGSGAIATNGPWTYDVTPATFHGNQWSIELHGDIDAGPGKISTTTYYESEPTRININEAFLNSPIVPVNIAGHPQDFSQEILYTTNQLGRFRGVFGAFYYNSRDNNDTRVSNPNGPFTPAPNRGPSQIGVYSEDKAKSYALFGELTANITDKLSLTGGLRYTDETRSANALLDANGCYAAFNGLPLFTCLPVVANPFVKPPISQWAGLGGFGLHHHTWNSWTSRIELAYKLTPHTNIYFTTSNGFTSGAYNETSFQATPANPETVSTYEVGIKSNELPNLSFSAAGFYDDYTNLQTYSTTFVGTTPVALLGNAAKAKIYGVELNAQWHATENLDFIAGATILSATYSNYPGAEVLTPIPCSSIIPSFPGLCGNAASFKNIKGTNLIRTPPWSGDVTANYHRDFAVGRLDASATVYFSGKVYWYYNNSIPQSPYALLNGTIGFRPAGSNVHISVWGKNLTNAAVINSNSSSTNYVNTDYNPQREYGVALKYDF